jgi:hypothetical protein
VIFNRRGEQLPHGPHAEIFFRGGGDLIIFPTSNNFKRSRIRCPSEPQAFSNACAKLVSGWVFPRQNLAYLFSGRRGAIKSAEFSHRDRWAPSHEWPQNSAKLFLDGAPGTIKGLLARVAATHQPAGRRREVGHPRRR